ncbi:MAG: type II toxin-antitoxin system VapC family toxin [Kiritimatiellae bacterium]|nr:type II toxin-antitoxin system VapC family toxin [Kiritimatiellia bacterium]MDD4735286.1 type II toxin-antitoxin system VapC family toxin [Kiritimatiellia bacterium]
MSALMLDTCGLIWLANGGGALSRKALTAIQDADLVYVSAVSAMEIGCKASLGKLALRMNAAQWYQTVLEVHDLIEIPLEGQVAIRAAFLPQHHRDPADRIIIATALERKLSVVTHDRRFASYGVSLVE